MDGFVTRRNRGPKFVFATGDGADERTFDLQRARDGLGPRLQMFAEQPIAKAGDGGGER